MGCPSPRLKQKWMTLKERKDELDGHVKLINHAATVKMKNFDKEVKQVEEQNEMLSSQIDTQEQIIEEQLKEIEKLLKEEQEYQIEARRQELEYMKNNPEPDEYFDGMDDPNLREFITGGNVKDIEVRMITRNNTEQDEDRIKNRLHTFENNDAEEIRIENDKDPFDEADIADDHAGNKKTISIQANTIGSQDFEEMVKRGTSRVIKPRSKQEMANDEDEDWGMDEF